MNSIDNKWESLRNRLRSEAYRTLNRSADGIAIVTVHVLIDADGRPLLWVVRNGKPIEPKKDAKKAVRLLLGVLADEED